MKSREELREAYEEALFAVIMEDLMELQGAAFAEAEQRLSAADEVPAAADKRCAAYIKALVQKREAEGKPLRTRHLWRTLLVAVIVMSLCFTTAYATVPAVRMLADDFIIAVSDISVTLFYGNEADLSYREEYAFWYMPEGFVLTTEGDEENHSWYLYQNGEASISIQVYYGSTDWEIEADTENADSVEPIETNLVSGMLIKKQNRCHAAVTDEAHGNFLQIVFKNVDIEDVHKVLENVHYVGERIILN